MDVQNSQKMNSDDSDVGSEVGEEDENNSYHDFFKRSNQISENYRRNNI